MVGRTLLYPIYEVVRPFTHGSGPGLPTVRLLGEKGGTEASVITVSHLPSHSHGIPGGSISTDTTGGGESFTNQQPFLGLNYNIAIQGLFPSRNLGTDDDDGQDTEDVLGEGFVSGTLVLEEADALPLIQAIFQEGIDRWASVGISEEQIAQLQSTEIRLRDLASGRLAAADHDVITIDRDASNRGWFIDATPSDDAEFGETDPRTGELVGTADGTQNHYDLLTAIMHEQGHILGIEHTELPGELMYGGLQTGGRRLPDSSMLVFEEHDHDHEEEETEYLAGGEPVLASIGIFAGNFNPRGWLQTDGQTLPISQNSALFTAMGTTYGGDGETDFQLPELRGRAVVGAGQLPGGNNYSLGQVAGEALTTLTTAQIPAHSHDSHVVHPTSGTHRISVVDGDVYVDSGGVDGNYQAGEDGTLTLDAGSGRLQVDFTEFVVESGGDKLAIYDGPEVSSPLIGEFSREGDDDLGTAPGTITASGSSLTFQFLSDSDRHLAGWRADINVLTASASIDGDGNLVINEAGGDTDDDLAIAFDGTNYTITLAGGVLGDGGIAGASGNGTNTLTIPAASITGSQIIVNGGGGNDQLTVDLTGTTPTQHITFHGGGQAGAPGDTLVLDGGTFTNTNYDFDNENDGSIDLDGFNVTYTGLEPITSTITATNVILNYSGVDETITVTNAGGGQTTVDSTAGEITTFNNPTESLTINAGDGTDVIDIDSLAPGYVAAITVDGQGGTDTININGRLTTEIAPTLDAETLQLGNDSDVRLIDTLAGNYNGSDGDTLTVISNDGAGAVVGTFANHPEGSMVYFDGDVYTLSYVGGDGNDVELAFLRNLGEFIDPNPSPGNQFGHSVVPLETGNVVITSPFDDAGGVDAGAVYLFDGSTGALISTLTGSSDADQVGEFGVTALEGGSYVVSSRFWNNGGVSNAGAVTFGDGTTGVSGVVSATNSLVGIHGERPSWQNSV